MKKKRLIWHICPAYILLLTTAMALASFAACRIVRDYHYERTQEKLRAVAQLVARQLAAQPDSLDAADTAALCRSLSEASGCRLTVILASGEVLGDSEGDARDMDDHSDREEVREAMERGMGRSVRYSRTLGEDMMYVAVPFQSAGVRSGAVRASLSLARVDRALGSIRGQIAAAALVMIALAVAAALVIARHISDPLEHIGRSAESLARGEAFHAVPSSGISEVDTLARTLNAMARQLDERAAVVRRQHDEQSALLGCMVEGVIAVDTEKRVIRINESALRLLKADAAGVLGRSIMEVLRNAELLDLVNEALRSPEAVEREIVLAETGTRLQCHGTALRNESGQRRGAVLVLNDVTRLRAAGASV